MSASTSYRIGPRTKRRGRTGSRIDWERTGRIALVLVFFVILILYVNPVVNFVDAWQGSRTEAQQLETLKDENEALRKRAQLLEAPDAAERGVRELGMVAPGERSVVIE